MEIPHMLTPAMKDYLQKEANEERLFKLSLIASFLAGVLFIIIIL